MEKVKVANELALMVWRKIGQALVKRNECEDEEVRKAMERAKVIEVDTCVEGGFPERVVFEDGSVVEFWVCEHVDGYGCGDEVVKVGEDRYAHVFRR